MVTRLKIVLLVTDDTCFTTKKFKCKSRKKQINWSLIYTSIAIVCKANKTVINHFLSISPITFKRRSKTNKCCKETGNGEEEVTTSGRDFLITKQVQNTLCTWHGVTLSGAGERSCGNGPSCASPAALWRERQRTAASSSEVIEGIWRPWTGASVSCAGSAEALIRPGLKKKKKKRSTISICGMKLRSFF